MRTRIKKKHVIMECLGVHIEITFSLEYELALLEVECSTSIGAPFFPGWCSHLKSYFDIKKVVPQTLSYHSHDVKCILLYL